MRTLLLILNVSLFWPSLLLPQIKMEKVGTVFCTLTDLVVISDNEIIVSCKEGQVIRWTLTTQDTLTDFADVALQVGESGLLGIAMIGDTLYANYTDFNYNQQIMRVYPDFDTVLTIVRDGPPFPNHRGGDMDTWSGNLLISIGEALGIYGGILVFCPGSLPDTLAVGLRNPWRIHVSGDSLFITDVGDQDREEISLVSLESIQEANLGWPCFEGTFPLIPPPGEDCEEDYLEPWFEYPRNPGGSAIIGGYMSPLGFIFADHYKKDLYLLSEGEIDTFPGFRYLTGIDQNKAISWDGRIYNIVVDYTSGFTQSPPSAKQEGASFFISIDGKRFSSLKGVPAGLYIDNLGHRYAISGSE